MKTLLRAVCAFARASLHLAFRLLRFVFILGLVCLPAPLTAWLVVVLERVPRNLPAEILRKKDDEEPSFPNILR